MLITVTTPFGITYSFNIEISENIFELKTKLEKETNIESDKMKLYFKEELLLDSRTFEEIEEGSILNMRVDKGRAVQIFARTLDGSSVSIDTFEKEKIIDLKQIIKEKIGLAVEEQKLVFGGRVLKDGETIRECGMENGSVIDIAARLKSGIQIFGKTMDGRTFPIEVQGSDKIFDIKKKIQEKIEKSPDEQKLVYNGYLLEDDKAVDEYQIQNQSVINIIIRLRGGMQIFAKTLDGKTFALEVQKSDKISDIKKKIQEKIGLAPDEQILMYQGGILEDDRTVDDYQIADKSVINVVARLRIELLVRTVDGRTHPFTVYSGGKVIDLKKSIEQSIGYPSNQQRLMLGTEILDDDKIIDEYSIPNQSIIDCHRISP